MFLFINVVNISDSERIPKEDKGRRPWKKPSSNQSHFFQMCFLCLEEFSSCGLGGLSESGLTAPPRGALSNSRQHLAATSPARPPSLLFFPLFFAALIANTCGLFPGPAAKPTELALSSALRHVLGLRGGRSHLSSEKVSLR